MERQEVADAIRAVQRDHHQTATAFCTCGWMPDPVPLNPDGSGDQDRMEQMREQHVMDVMLDAIEETDAQAQKADAPGHKHEGRAHDTRRREGCRSLFRRAWDWFCGNVLDPEPTDFSSYEEELR